MPRLFSDIRPGERRETIIAFLTLFGIMGSHALQETARDALFLASVPPARLAWVYLAIALVSFLLFIVQQRSRRITQARRGLLVWILGSAVVTLGFWGLVNQTGSWVLYALYTWSGVFATGVVVRFWTLVGDLFTVSQAKRVFAFIGVGSVLGAIAGSALAGLLTSLVPARHLLLASAGMLVATAVGPLPRLPQPRQLPKPPGEPEGGLPRRAMFGPLRTSWESPYLRRVGTIVLISTVALTVVDYLFKSAVATHVSPDRMGSVFAWTYLGLNGLSLLAQVTLVGWMVRAFGVNRVLSLLPSLILAGALAVLAGGGLIAAFVLKAFDGGLRHSLHRTATEVLYVPLTTDLRNRVKGFIDVAGQRGGQALASIAILVAALAGSLQVAILATLVAVLSWLWIRTAGSLKQHYLDLFRENLSEVALQTRVDFPQLDLASLETLMEGLNSPDDARVVASLDILAEQGRARLVPALILYHPSSSVVLRGLELFTLEGRSDFIPITERLLEHPDAEIRAATLRARAWVDPDPVLFERCAADPSPTVRATALVGMVSFGVLGPEEAERTLLELAGGGTPGERLALARAIRYSPGAMYEGVLILLAETRDPDVLEAVARAMAEVRSPRFIPRLLSMLEDRQVRGQARSTLVSLGEEAWEALLQALVDPHLKNSIRRQLPRTIAQFDPDRAAEVLVRHLNVEQDGAVRYRVLRSLSSLRSSHPELVLDGEALERALQANLRSILRLVNWQLNIIEANGEDPARKTLVQDLIGKLLQHKERQAVERLFRLLGLLYPEEDLFSIHRGIRSSNPSLRASSMELLENLLSSSLRETVTAVVDDISLEDKLRRGENYHRHEHVDYPTLLTQLLERPGTGVRSLVAYHVGELRLTGMRSALEELPGDPAGMVSQSVERALAVLGEQSPSPGKADHGIPG